MPAENLVAILADENSFLNRLSMNTEVHDYNFLESVQMIILSGTKNC